MTTTYDGAVWALEMSVQHPEKDYRHNVTVYVACETLQRAVEIAVETKGPTSKVDHVRRVTGGHWPLIIDDDVTTDQCAMPGCSEQVMMPPTCCWLHEG